jgi:hypothetical protein
LRGWCDSNQNLSKASASAGWCPRLPPLRVGIQASLKGLPLKQEVSLLTRSPSYSSSIPLPHCGPRGSFLPSLSHPEPSALPWTGYKSPPSGLSCLLTLLFANAAPAGVPALNGTANMPALGQPSAKGPGGAQSSQLCPSQSTQAAGGVPNWPSPPASEGQMLWERSACWYCSMKVDPPCLPTIRVAALIRCLSKPWMRAGGGARVRVIHLFFPFLFFFFFFFFF